MPGTDRSRSTKTCRLARDTYRIRFACPEIARRIVPGQFVMLRLADCNDPLLGRPLALYDVVPDADGRAAFAGHRLSGRRQDDPAAGRVSAGSRLEVWGPLGNGFPPTPTEHLVMVAGGIGQTPFLALAREYLGLHAYGDPPRQRAPRQAGDALLRRPHAASTWPASRISAVPGRRRAAEHRRRLAGPSRAGDRPDPAGGASTRRGRAGSSAAARRR